MTNDELKRERRKQNRLEKLGTNDPHCGTCGEDRYHCIERHHIAGQRYDSETTVLLCRNCHRIASDAQCDHPVAADPNDPFLFRVGRFLLGLADMLRIVVETLYAFGRDLTARAVAPVEDGR